MVDFAKLKANSGKAALDKLATELQKIGAKQFGNNDENLWKPTVDKAGNGYAVIRCLGAHDDDNDTPYVRYFDHGFQGPSGSWYFENSLTTFGKPDPVSEYNSTLWNSGLESDKELARKYKRRQHFVTRILVITDKGKPENEGKVFYWKFGKKLFKKLVEDAMTPEFEDETPINAFDLWDGANFMLKIRNVEGYRNYDKSEFAKPAPLGSDDEILAVMEQAEALPLIKEFMAPNKYKPYDELKAKFDKVMGLDGSSPVNRAKAADLETEEFVSPKAASRKPVPAVVEEEDDETSKFFASLNDDE